MMYVVPNVLYPIFIATFFFLIGDGDNLTYCIDYFIIFRCIYYVEIWRLKCISFQVPTNVKYKVKFYVHRNKIAAMKIEFKRKI